MESTNVLRIGELSRRVGVSAELLRAWERRYGLLRPARSPGGLRLYSLEDVERVGLMQEHLARGLAAAEAAALATRAEEPGRPATALDLGEARRELGAALESFDEPRAQAVLDGLLAATTLDCTLSEVVMPYLHELGERWERTQTSVAQEHFGTAVLRGRLLGLARGWGRGVGPRAVLACAPGEQHDLALLAFGLALRERGWRIVYLGPDSPLESVAEAADAAGPEAVIVSAVTPARLETIEGQLAQLAARHRLYLAGPGAAAARLAVDRLAGQLTGSPVDEAERLVQLTSARREAV